MGALVAIPFVLGVMGMSASILYDTLRGVSIRNKSVMYFIVTLMASLSVGIVIMMVVSTTLPTLTPIEVVAPR